MPRLASVENHPERDFTVDAPNHKWVTDITNIRTAEHWLCLCLELDLRNHLAVGWSMGRRQDRGLVLQTVLIAL